MKKNGLHPGFEMYILASSSLILFLTLEITARVRGWYQTFPLIDVATHFTAGIAMFYIFYWIATIMQDKYRKRLAFAYTFVTSIIWELVEIIEELIIPNPPHLKDIFFFDGVFDIIFALIGAGIGALYISKFRYYFRHKLKNSFNHTHSNNR